MSKRQKIIYCEGNVDGTIGGSYFSLLFLVSGLNRQKYEPVVVFRREHVLMEKFRDAGIEVTVLPSPVAIPLEVLDQGLTSLPFVRDLTAKVRPGINFLKLFWWDAIKLAWWLHRSGADLVHLNNSVTRTHSWMLAAQVLRIPCITHERGMNVTYSRIARFFAPRLARIICISEAVRDNLIAHDLPQGNLTVIHNGIDPNLYTPLRSVDEVKEELGIDPSVPVVGIVGNLRTWKGQDVVVRAVGRLIRRYPTLKCVFVGASTDRDQAFVDHLRQLALDHSIGERLIFTGYQKQVADYMNVMDIVIHASVDPEPFGRVLIEAMALGKPVIGSRAGAVPEILNEPDCGLTFPPGDDASLADCIDLLLAQDGTRVTMGEAGRRRVREDFAIERNVRDTERIYVDVLEKGRG